ncbi:CHAT domain-containing protein [Agromyces ramosus]|uniref:CHAT domain-containing protein n=1 Tax=Agromyces ramosus TaxID=33879 RepID=UPI00102B295C|nr:CHAT domain-containing protein [Agromyces ramosus]
MQVVRSPAGEASATFTLDSDRLLDERPNLQNALLLSSVSSRRAAVSGNEGLVQTVGRELFNAVFGPKAIAGLYAANRALADATQEELRIVLRTECPELAALPWEVMYDSDADAYVCQREPLVRHVPVATAPPPLRVRGAVRILGVVSSPRGLAMLDVDKEKENLISALAGPAKRGLVDLQWAPDATWSTLQELLLSEEWHVIHFIGHGDFDFEREEGILALVGKDGRTHRVEGSRFVVLLRQARPMPRLVVLNSCSSATSSSQDLFSGTAAALVRGGVSAVAAMQFEITDSAAIEFCRGFYNAVAHGRGVDEAVGSGRVAILGSSGDTLEWLTPVLYLRGLDSQLFAVERAGADGAPPPPSAEERVAQAQEALDEHDAATAIPVLDTVLADDPENAPAQELRGATVEDVGSVSRNAAAISVLEGRIIEMRDLERDIRARLRSIFSSAFQRLGSSDDFVLQAFAREHGQQLDRFLEEMSRKLIGLSIVNDDQSNEGDQLFVDPEAVRIRELIEFASQYRMRLETWLLTIRGDLAHLATRTDFYGQPAESLRAELGRYFQAQLERLGPSAA